MKKTITIILLLIFNTFFAQNICQSGNCVNGYGKITYGKWGIYVGNFTNGQKNGQGMYAYMIGKDTSNVYRGNFKDDEFFGKGSFHVYPFCVYTSDNWTDSQNFTSGKMIRDDTKKVTEGAYVRLFFEEKNITTASNNVSQTSIKTRESVPQGTFKTYMFQTNCSYNGQSFEVISRIAANIGITPFEEIKNEAIRVMQRKNWSVNSNTEYLGIEEEVVLKGLAGKDYVVSDGNFYVVKNNSSSQLDMYMPYKKN